MSSAIKVYRETVTSSYFEQNKVVVEDAILFPIKVLKILNKYINNFLFFF